MTDEKRTLDTLNSVKLTTFECLALSSAVVAYMKADYCDEDEEKFLLQPALAKLLAAGCIDMVDGPEGVAFTVHVTQCPDCEGGEE